MDEILLNYLSLVHISWLVFIRRYTSEAFLLQNLASYDALTYALHAYKYKKILPQKLSNEQLQLKLMMIDLQQRMF